MLLITYITLSPGSFHLAERPLIDLNELDERIVPKYFAKFVGEVRDRLLSGSCLRDRSSTDPRPLEVAKIILEHSWKSKRREFIEKLRESIKDIINFGNPRFQAYTPVFSRYESPCDFQQFRDKFVGFNMRIHCENVFEALFQADVSSAERMFDFVEATLNHRNTKITLPDNDYYSSRSRARKIANCEYDLQFLQESIMCGNRVSLECYNHVEFFRMRIARLKEALGIANEESIDTVADDLNQPKDVHRSATREEMLRSLGLHVTVLKCPDYTKIS